MNRHLRLGAVAGRASMSLVLVALALVVTRAAWAQVPGENVNIVSGTEWPGGDPFLQRQNEPAVAVSSANPMHVVAFANDYRSVDIPNPAGGGEPNTDAWVGVFKSLDGGQTWKSVLLPGYPQDPACQAGGAGNPLCGLRAAADPVVRAGTDGMFYFSGINFQRDRQRSRVYLARYIDYNDKENGDATKSSDPVQYVDTNIVAEAPAGWFVDKPWMAVDLPRAQALRCTIPPSRDGLRPARSFPGGTIYVGWAQFPASGPEISSNVLLKYSQDCGKTWSAPIQLNGVNSLLNQGVAIAIDPLTARVHVAWRRFASGTQTNAIMASRSAGRSKMFATARVVAAVVPFDQSDDPVSGTTSTRFRTESLPSIAVSTDGKSSWAHVAWAQRLVNGESRVVVSSAQVFPAPSGEQDPDDPPTSDAETRLSWSPPSVLDDPAASAEAGIYDAHQFMPSITFGQGRLMVLYYDSRYDHTRRYYVPIAPAPDGNGKWFTEKLSPRGNLLQGPASVFTPFIGDDDDFTLGVRHTLDVRVATASAGGHPTFRSVPVTQFRYGLRGDEATMSPLPATVPLLTGGSLAVVDGNGTPLVLQQLALNPPNLPMFQGGHVPFIGDYIDIQGPVFVPTSNGGWQYNLAYTPAPVFHAVWTSNQDVRPPRTCDAQGNCVPAPWTQYTPIKPPGTMLYDGGAADGNTTTPACISGSEGSRDQNVYTSRITDGLFVSSPQNVKPLAASVVRGFVVFARNSTPKDMTVTFAVSRADPGVVSSFTVAGLTSSPVTSLPGLVVPAASHVYRTLFVTVPSGGNPYASIDVTVTETGCTTGCRSGFVTLNPPVALASILPPDGGGNPAAGDSYSASFDIGVISTPAISSPAISSPAISSPAISSPAISSPAISSPAISSMNVMANPDLADVSAPAISSPAISSPAISSPAISSPAISSPAISSPAISSAAPSDVTYVVTNNGNTTTSYHVRLVTGSTDLPNLRLIVSKIYFTQTGVNCELRPLANEQLVGTAVLAAGQPSAALVAPGDKVDPGATDGRASNLTLALQPKEAALITLRGYITLGEMATRVAGKVTPVLVSSAVVKSAAVTYEQYVTNGAPGAVASRVPTQTVLTYSAGTATATVTRDLPPPPAPARMRGYVTFLRNGTELVGNVSFDSVEVTTGFAVATPVTLGPGDTLIAYYGGDKLNAPSASNAVPMPTITTLTYSVGVATAVVQETAGGGIPAGVVTFTNDGANVGSATLDSQGVGLLSISLSLGDSLVAQYGGDPNHLPSTSNTYRNARAFCLLRDAGAGDPQSPLAPDVTATSARVPVPDAGLFTCGFGITDLTPMNTAFQVLCTADAVWPALVGLYCANHPAGTSVPPPEGELFYTAPCGYWQTFFGLWSFATTCP